jgi:hypothetical protein
MSERDESLDGGGLHDAENTGCRKTEDGALEHHRADVLAFFRSARTTQLAGPLEHFQFDTFIVRWTDRQLMADAYLSFGMTPEGSIDRITMKAVSPATDFSFDFHDLDLRRVTE